MRTESLVDENLTIIGKVSLRLSNINVVKNLKAGTWLDLLSGYNSNLQKSQLGNNKIKKLISLDLKLNNTLAKTNFELIETVIDKKIPFPSEGVDNITLINGLEHLSYPQEIINECFRVIKPGGILQIIVPTWFAKPVLEFLAFALNNKQYRREMNDHKMYYDEKTLWPMLVKAGFKPQDIRLRRIKFYFSLYAKATKA